MKRYVDDIGFGFVIMVIGLSLVFLVMPIVVAVMMSFDGRAYLGMFPPPNYSIQWYQKFFSDAYYLHGLKISLILALIAGIVSTASGVSAAIVLDRYEFRGKKAL